MWSYASSKIPTIAVPGHISDVMSVLDRVKRIWYLSPMRTAKVQASLRIRAVSPEPSLLAHTSSESRGTFNQKARSLAHLNGWACAVKICHDGMLEDTNSLDGARIAFYSATIPLMSSQITRSQAKETNAGVALTHYSSVYSEHLSYTN